MNRPQADIDPRLDSLPTEGKAEYLRWSETYHRLISSYLAGVEKLKEIRKLDPAHAALYDWKAETLQRQAAEAMDEWQGHRSRILGKWLSGH